MKITRKSNRTTLTFSEVGAAAVFTIGSSPNIYMKLDINGSDNAVNLETGVGLQLSQIRVVNLVEAELTVSE